MKVKARKSLNTVADIEVYLYSKTKQGGTNNYICTLYTHLDELCIVLEETIRHYYASQSGTIMTWLGNIINYEYSEVCLFGKQLT